MAFKKINDVSCKDSTVAISVDFSDVDPVTRREFKTSALNGSEYFTSLEMARNIKSQITLKTAIVGGNIISKLFDELSHFDFNFGEYKNSTDSSISTKVNSLMVDAIDIDEKFAMMEQIIETLKKSIDDKYLQITQLMSKLDLYNSGESHHILTIQEKVDIDSPTKLIDSQILRPVVSPRIEEDVIILQFWSFEPVEVFALKKTTNKFKGIDMTFKEREKTLQQAFCNWWKLHHYIALRRSHQWSSSRRSTCNDKVLPDVPGDQMHLKEVYIILHSRNTLLNALESRKNLGEKNQENNRIVLTKIHQ
ncbi:hypothetical protein H5410_034368 [Solanum commersonii]|uniref:Uncharacterized protein n=1 Tax=Solanum commersonii TaxID=4109 RepID=A0A9J5YVV3_SOLCO|nr:hypothetical protein H5410_034368 [Solanum commersonii]